MVIQETKNISHQINNQIIPDILRSVHNLAITYSKAKSDPARYAQYGYDFPKLIEGKINLLIPHIGDQPWLKDIYVDLIDAVNNPIKLIIICHPLIGE